MTDSVSRRRRPRPLAYRRASHHQFVTEMAGELMRRRPGGPLARTLATGAIDDPTIALIDAWAAVADVVQFYQERIATESFLATAVEAESILALAALVGHRPRPGLAATVWLAYTLNPDPADTAVALPAGLLVQSVPRTGELPQTFETTDEFVARPSWNLLRPRTTAPLSIAAGHVEDVKELLIGGMSTGLNPNDVLLLRPDGADPEPVRVNRVAVDLITQRSTVTLQTMHPAATGKSRVSAFAFRPQPAPIDDQPSPPSDPHQTVTNTLDELVKALRPSPADASVPPPAKPAAQREHVASFAASFRVASAPAQPEADSVPAPPAPAVTVPDVVTRLPIVLEPTLATSLYPALATTQVGGPAVQSVFAQRVKAAPFGVQMPPRVVIAEDGKLALDDSKNPKTQEWPIAITDRTVLELDATYDGIVAGSWVVVDRAGGAGIANPTGAEEQVHYPVVAQVISADRVTVTRYGLGVKVTRLHLDRSWIGSDAKDLSDLRELSVHAQSEELNLLPVPIGGHLDGNTIELEGLFPGIEVGRTLLLTGNAHHQLQPAGAPATEASVVTGETVQVAAVDHACHPGGDTLHTQLTLVKPLRNAYQLDSVRLYGNMVRAHQAATIQENLVAAGGDPAHPTFTLAQAPVLADPAPTAAGSLLSLTITVDGRRWDAVPRFGSPPPPRSYLTGTDHQGRTTITFSEPLPHLDSTVTATYRSGHGALGNVRAGQLTQALSRPLAVAGVDNPLPASGGADPDGSDVLRAHAPVGLQAVGRLVSVTDATDLALSWAGVGKADAQLGSDGYRQVLTMTIAGVTPEPLEPDSELCVGLAAALRAAGDPAVPVIVLPAVLSLILLAAEVDHDPDITWDTVERAVRDALLEGYSYARRGLGEDVILSDLIAVAHQVQAVRSFVITGLALVDAHTETSQLLRFAHQLPPPPADGRWVIPSTTVDGSQGAHIAYLSDLAAGSLHLQERRS